MMCPISNNWSYLTLGLSRYLAQASCHFNLIYSTHPLLGIDGRQLCLQGPIIMFIFARPTEASSWRKLDTLRSNWESSRGYFAR